MKGIVKYFFVACLAVLWVLAILTGCKTPKNPALETKDKDVTLQIVRLINAPGADSLYTYKARIIPAKILLESKDEKDREALTYQMDSCFYLLSPSGKIYASLVQPVANGIRGCFEYLLEFEKPGSSDSGDDFVYQDKYLTRKKYSIHINPENL